MARDWKRTSKLIISVLHTCVFTMELITIINSHWIGKQTSLGMYHQGLWQSCLSDTCMKIESSGTQLKIASINMVRVTIILAAVFCFFACVLSIKINLKFVAISAAVSCSFNTSAMAIFTHETHGQISGSTGFMYDWAYVLGWISATSGFIAAFGTAITTCLLLRNSHEEIIP